MRNFQCQQQLAWVLCNAVTALCSSLTYLLAGEGSSTACLLLQGSFLGCLVECKFVRLKPDALAKVGCVKSGLCQGYLLADA